MARVKMRLNTKTGERTFEVEGAAGEACTDITKAITDSNEVLEQEFTSEYCMPDEMPDYVEQGE